MAQFRVPYAVLNEMCQARRLSSLEYTDLGRGDTEFVCYVSCVFKNRIIVETGKGTSKKRAKSDGAAKLLVTIHEVEEHKLPTAGDTKSSVFLIGRQSALKPPAPIATTDESVTGSEQTVSGNASPVSLVDSEVYEDASCLLNGNECGYGREKDVFIVDSDAYRHETVEERIEREWWESL